MFGNKKEKPKRDHSGKSLSQYGLFDIPTNFDTGLGNTNDDEGDSDLEAELAALSGEGGSEPSRRKPPKKVIPQRELDAMVAASMRDAPSDDEISIDENDPELLGELNELTGEDGAEEIVSSPMEPTGVSSSNVDIILSERLKKYEVAEQNAKSAGETGKARRYGRAIKTLKDLVKQAKSGKSIDLNDESVPPEIVVGAGKPQDEGQPIPPSVPTRPAPMIPIEGTNSAPLPEPTQIPDSIQENVEEKKQEIDQELLNMLVERQKEYKIAALHAKKSGDTQTAVRFVKLAKQFESVIAAVQSGQAVDLSKMPGPPGESPTRPEPKVEESEIQKNTISEIPIPAEAEDLPPQELVTASTVLEALEQHLAVYKEHEAQAKEQGNSSKSRRLGRIIKQFEQAIKQHKAGKTVAFDELPTPPGYAPISVEGPAAPVPQQIAPKEMPTPPPRRSAEGGEDKASSPGSRVSGNRVTTSHADKQVLILLAKQKQFKQAALSAKQKGEITEAKEFLRQAKGFDKLIEAARGGLPVDWSSIPVSPEAKSQLDNEYNIVMAEECDEDSTGDVDIIACLENQLQKQLKMCLSTRDHNKALGDVPGTNRFERLALNVTKDLDVVRLAQRSGSKIPKFHYEMKEFSIVKSFTELMDNDMELVIIRGINYQSANPKDIDTYVKFEFPYPQDTPYSDRTSTVKDTNNPEYNTTFTIPIQRSARHCQRVFKRHGMKFEVYSKGGFFRSDTLIGTANVKLQPLETQCELHDSFDLLEGRRKVGGKLEVQIRLRNPIVTQQVEQIEEKWLIIDQ